MTSCSAYCDGIVSAGIVPGDDPRYMTKSAPVILPVRKPGAMWLDITVTEVET